MAGEVLLKLSPDDWQNLLAAARREAARAANERMRAYPKRNPAHVETFRGQLTSALSEGGSANAKLLVRDSAGTGWEVVGDTFTVYDDYWGDLSGDAPDKIVFQWTGSDRRTVMGIKCAS